MSSEHVEVLRELRDTGDVSDWRAMESALDAAIASLSAQQSRDAESKLAEAGVFAGHHGLRGLADADEFWEAQPYGTRLYYGDGGMDYLHRGVLQKAIEILDAAPQPPAEAQPVACDEDRFEQFLQAAIARSPEPLRELGEYLAGVLDDDQWPAADRLLLQLATSTPSAPVGVEWPLSLLRAGHWREVYIGHRCMRLEVTYDYATWERLMAEVESALAPQPPAEAQPVDSGVFDKVIEDALRYGTGTLRVEHVPYDDFRMPPSAPVGVEQIIATDEAGWALAKRAEVAGAERDSDDNETWWTLRIEQFKVLTQQPAAVDEAMVERLAQAVATELYGEPPPPGSNSLTRAMMLPGIKRALTATLAAQQGGTQE